MASEPHEQALRHLQLHKGVARNWCSGWLPAFGETKRVCNFHSSVANEYIRYATVLRATRDTPEHVDFIRSFECWNDAVADQMRHSEYSFAAANEQRNRADRLHSSAHVDSLQHAPTDPSPH